MQNLTDYQIIRFSIFKMILLCFVFSLHGNYLKNCPKYHNCKVSRWAQIEFLKTYELYHLASCSAFDNKTKLNTCNCTDYCKCKKVILDIMPLFSCNAGYLLCPATNKKPRAQYSPLTFI